MARVSVEAQRREQIVEAAIAVVARKGYEATTVRDVAEEAGTSTGTLTYYYASKEDMLASALAAVAERFERRADDAVAAADDPRAVLEALVDVCTPDDAEAVALQVVWTAFWARAARTDGVREQHERLYDAWRARIAKVVADGVRRGAFRPVEPGVWARDFAALLDGLALHVLLHPGTVGPEAMRDAGRRFLAATLDA